MDAKNAKIALWLIFVAVSVFSLGIRFNPEGAVVTFVEKDSPAKGVEAGSIIYKINDNKASAELLGRNYTGFVTLETNKGKKFINANGTLGISSKDVSPTNLRFGLDIEGGVLAVVKLNDSSLAEQTLSVLQTRTNVYGLRESVFRPMRYHDDTFIEISMSGGTKEELKDLLEHQGKFEAKIPVALKLKDNTTSMELSKKYYIEIRDGAVVVENITVPAGEEFSLDSIKFVLESASGKINLTSTVYSGNDIVNVFFDPQRSRIERTGKGYSWSFAVQISNEGAEKFAAVTRNVPRQLNYLESPINLYLDGELIDSLSISSSLRGSVTTEISITGGADTLDQAKNEQLKLQSILRSGSLPTEIEIVSLNTLSPTLGTGFIRSSVVTALYAILAVAVIMILRYRNLPAAIAMILVSLSEVLIILGASVFIGWTLDLSAIAGIIAAVGTGVDSQIIIMDQALRKEEKLETLKEKLKRAFFIIFGSAGVVIAAMFPLMIFGFGLLRGFAITTMIGVLAGVLITRPAFGVIVEHLLKK